MIGNRNDVLPVQDKPEMIPTMTTTTTSPLEKRGRGRPRGTRNKKTTTISPKTEATTATAMPKVITHLLFLIDESGSMTRCAEDVRGGFNSYVDALRSDDGGNGGNLYTLTAIKFGTTVRPLFLNLPLAEVPLLTKENYRPSDTTALYDALGHAFSVAAEAWATPEKPYGVEPTYLIIQTDGQENASTKYSKATIVEKMRQRQKAGNWTIVYLGADQDAWGEASQLGIPQGNTLSYDSATGTNSMYHHLAAATTASVTSGRMATRGFFSPIVSSSGGSWGGEDSGTQSWSDGTAVEESNTTAAQLNQ